MSVERVRSRDGLALVVEHYDVADARARVVLVHGYAEHRGRYAALIRQLGAEGIECHAADLRGHGQSEGPRGHVNRFEDYLDDLERVVDSVRGRGGSAPLLVLAHSLGGLIALCYVRARPGTRYDGPYVQRMTQLAPPDEVRGPAGAARDRVDRRTHRPRR